MVWVLSNSIPLRYIFEKVPCVESFFSVIWIFWLNELRQLHRQCSVYLRGVESLLIVLIAAAFLGMLGVNVLFRARVLKAYRSLQRNGIEFDGSDMLTQARIEELVGRFPDHEADIRQFTGGIRRSVSLASALIVLITLLGAVLMWYR